METPDTITGRTRRRRTSRMVRLSDTLARWIVVCGGIGTIGAVSMVFVFLLWVAWPLFRPPTLGEAAPFASPHAAGAAPRLFGVNEHRSLAWTIAADGQLTVAGLPADGEVGWHEPRAWPGGGQPTAAAWTPGVEGYVALGFADGRIQLGRLAFESENVVDEITLSTLGDLPEGSRRRHDDGAATRGVGGQWQIARCAVDLKPSIASGARAPVRLIDRTADSRGSSLAAAWTEDGKVWLFKVRERENRRTKKVTVEAKTREIELSPAALAKGRPQSIFLSEFGDNLFVVWADGGLIRFEIRDFDSPRQAEEIDLLGDVSARVTAAAPLIGKSTLAVGDSLGRVRCWFMANVGAQGEGSLVLAHDLTPGESAVTALAASPLARTLAAGYADGRVRVFYPTNERLLAEGRLPNAAAVAAVAIAPRGDGLFALGDNAAAGWLLEAPHPEVGFRALLMPVWYESSPEPAHVWQSTSGSDSFEPKFGLTPLIFGTLKATFYSLAFGVPIALFAAIYTSEFMHARWRARIKPAIELMASLPSVVLGFFAAIILAPLLKDLTPELLTALVVVPLTLFAFAHLWQLAPDAVRWRVRRARFAFISVAILLGVAAAMALGKQVENVLFAGDLKAWLAGQVGGARGGWFLLLLPWAPIAIGWAVIAHVNPRLRGLTAAWGRLACAVLDLGKFIGGATLTLTLTWLISWGLEAAGFDPRGEGASTGLQAVHLIGAYEQRNALIVGLMMGFAIVPIIYTIAEDALSTVPEHLRAASLGAGATPWQTAIRIIVPTALSGLFSAVMVGFGRAVGETMIVLMAAGGTAIVDLNVFNGFRTLSANLATELGEAESGSTHYRVLFLTGLVLFAMTFALNTVAELVRQRFRKKAIQL